MNGRAVVAAVAAAVATVVAGGMLAACTGMGRYAAAGASLPASPSPRPTSAPPAAADAAAGFRSPRTPTTVARPVRVRIPSIGVDARLERLGLDGDGSIAAPQRYQDAGWYVGGPRPGQPGPAVLLGHVDSTTGPAVFYRLAGLPTGTEVLVDRTDLTTVRFHVSGRIQVAKSRFPADLVYGPTLAPSLRLVTCGGTFDWKSHHYRDNVIVSAVPDVDSP